MIAVAVRRQETSGLSFKAGDLAETLRHAIVSRQVRIGIIGLGHVGLPLGVAFAEAGFGVIGFDVNAERVESLNEGRSCGAGVSSGKVAALVDDGSFVAETDMSRLVEADVAIICVPTPLNKTRDPDISFVVTATEAVARSLRRGQLVILESTTYPGTTRDVVRPTLEETGLRASTDFFLAFSPERVDPGNPHFGVKNTPKVVGGLDTEATQLAALVYRQAIDSVVEMSSPEAAEMTKLLENTFRSVNIGLANETALMCNRLGLDVWEVIEAAATKPFGFMPFYPGPGIGGHCIPLDPYYLSWKMKTLDYRARFIELAGEINAQMPRYVVAKVVDGLNESKLSIKRADILVLGVAYKPDVDDYRESPALDIITQLLQRGARVSYSDPHVPLLALPDRSLASESLTPERLAAADCVIIVTDHRAFDYDLIVRYTSLIVDTRNALRDIKKNSGVILCL